MRFICLNTVFDENDEKEERKKTHFYDCLRCECEMASHLCNFFFSYFGMRIRTDTISQHSKSTVWSAGEKKNHALDSKRLPSK